MSENVQTDHWSLTLAKLNYEKENGLKLVIESDPSVPEQDQLQSLWEALAELSFITPDQLPAMAEEPRPPASDRNISSIASILRTPHGTPNLIPFLLSRVAQHRGSIALPGITLEPHNLIRPIEMSDMDPRVEGTEAQSSEVTEDEIL